MFLPRYRDFCYARSRSFSYSDSSELQSINHACSLNVFLIEVSSELFLIIWPNWFGRSTLCCTSGLLWSLAPQLHYPAIARALYRGDSVPGLLLSRSPKKLIWALSFHFLPPVGTSLGYFRLIPNSLPFFLPHLRVRHQQHDAKSNTVESKG